MKDIAKWIGLAAIFWALAYCSVEECRIRYKHWTEIHETARP